MADDVFKAQVEIDMTQESKEKLTTDLSDAISSGIDNKDNLDKFKSLFDFKNIKQQTVKNLSDAFGITAKQQATQNKLAGILKADQEKITKLVGTQGRGIKGNAQLFGLMGKQGATALAGIASKVNPIMLAVDLAVKATAELFKQIQRISKESAKFVGQGSLFTDRGTMDMMQRTGQTATQAQATNRSLGMLGLNFEDIQSGKITAEQAAAFEQLRLRELEKLEQINTVAGPMFKSLQQVTLGFSLLFQDIDDMITMAFAESEGITKFIDTLKSSLQPIAAFIGQIISALAPFFSVLGYALTNLTTILKVLLPSLTWFLNWFKFLFEIIEKIAKPVSELFSKVFQGIYEFLGGFINQIIGVLKSIKIGRFEPFKNFDYIDIPGAQTPGQTITNQTTNNYIYGSNNMNQSNAMQTNNLFTNSYVLVND